MASRLCIITADEPLGPQELRDAVDLLQVKLTSARSGLEAVGAVEMLPTGEAIALEDILDLQEAAAAAACLRQRRRWSELSRLEIMRGYAETPDCRRRYLLTYFSDAAEAPYGFCDGCEAAIPAETQEAPEPFPRRAGSRTRRGGRGWSSAMKRIK